MEEKKRRIFLYSCIWQLRTVVSFVPRICHAHKPICRQRHGTTVNIEEYIEGLFLLPIHYVEEVTGTLLLDSSLGTPLLKAFYPNPQSLLSPQYSPWITQDKSSFKSLIQNNLVFSRNLILSSLSKNLDKEHHPEIRYSKDTTKPNMMLVIWQYLDLFVTLNESNTLWLISNIVGMIT